MLTWFTLFITKGKTVVNADSVRQSVPVLFFILEGKFGNQEGILVIFFLFSFFLGTHND